VPFCYLAKLICQRIRHTLFLFSRTVENPRLGYCRIPRYPLPSLTSFGRLSASGRSYQRINNKLGKLVIRLVGVTADKSIKATTVDCRCCTARWQRRSQQALWRGEGAQRSTSCPQAARLGALAITVLTSSTVFLTMLQAKV
jgi:hypothetical protein